MAYRYLWNIYRNLANRRMIMESGYPASISFSEIDAFMRLTKTPLDPWEVSIITALDDFERGLHFEDRRKAQSRAQSKAGR